MPHSAPAPILLSLALLGLCFLGCIGLARRGATGHVRRIGPYRLGAKIGQGGMGEVYRAWHMAERRWCAVKLLPRGASQRDRNRFAQEVQLTARLRHPNTIAIHDYGQAADGTPYYAMELLEGATLQRLVEEQGAQPPSRVIDILLQLCAALAEAHSAGLVHRDIKPDNVFLCHRAGGGDLVKLLDFGLVKQLTSGAPVNQSLQFVVGTPLYLSPEAIDTPERVGPRSDLYALGAVAYFLLTGSPVFSGDNAIEVCHQHLYAVPKSPSLVRGQSIDEELENIVIACLAKDPRERPATATGLAEMLLRCRARAKPSRKVAGVVARPAWPVGITSSSGVQSYGQALAPC